MTTHHTKVILQTPSPTVYILMKRLKLKCLLAFNDTLTFKRTVPDWLLIKNKVIYNVFSVYSTEAFMPYKYTFQDVIYSNIYF